MVNRILNDIKLLEERFVQTRDFEALQSDVSAFNLKYGSYLGAGDLVLRIADTYYSRGDDEAGALLVKMVSDTKCQVANETMLCLRMAQYYIEKGNIAEGKAFLIRLCTATVSNYEESIANNDLTDLWEKYKHLVEGQVPKSVSRLASVAPIPPAKCSVPISELFMLPADDVLLALSHHVAELSANGDALNCLNKWEKLVFYVDELCMEVNSGGLGHYLYYHGHHFENAKKSVETIGATQTLDLLERISSEFPGKRIPKKIEAIQNALDALEERGVEFDNEDEQFYGSAGKELLDKLLCFVMENKHHFR